MGISPIFSVSKKGTNPSGNLGEVQEIQGNPPLVQLPVRPSHNLSLQSDSHWVALQPRFSNRHPCWEFSSAERLVNEPEEILQAKLEMVARAYDPCISCSVHLVRLTS